MKRQLLNFSSASMILLVGLFFSGCYTQLAKPGSERVEEDYYEDEYVESDYDYEYEDDEEYVEDYDEYYGDEDEVLIYDQYGYNYLEPYYYYDPFFDPFFAGLKPKR